MAKAYSGAKGKAGSKKPIRRVVPSWTRYGAKEVEMLVLKLNKEGQSRLLRRQLERRFGVLPSWATEQLANASEQQLEAWGEAILTAPTLEAVFN